MIYFIPLDNRPPGDNSQSPEFNMPNDDPKPITEQYDYIDEWGTHHKAELEFHLDGRERVLIDKIELWIYYGGTQWIPHKIQDEQYLKIYQAFPQYEFI